MIDDWLNKQDDKNSSEEYLLLEQVGRNIKRYETYLNRMFKNFEESKLIQKHLDDENKELGLINFQLKDKAAGLGIDVSHLMVDKKNKMKKIKAMKSFR